MTARERYARESSQARLDRADGTPTVTTARQARPALVQRRAVDRWAVRVMLARREAMWRARTGHPMLPRDRRCYRAALRSWQAEAARERELYGRRLP